MTDRLKGVTVVFDRDIRVDDAEAILAAIQMIKGVARVAPSISTSDDWMNRERVRIELVEKIFEVLKSNASS